jgi:hypothetical protein
VRLDHKSALVHEATLPLGVAYVLTHPNLQVWLIS